MVSQFISTHDVRLLGDLDFDFPAGTHAIGRLDSASEGLLILTTNKKVTRLLFQGAKKHKRKYLVMVKNVVSLETLELLRNGISFKVKGGVNYVSLPCEVEIIPDPAALYPYTADHRERFPHTWLLITLTEGKFHQVRKMVWGVKHPCFRLIRLSITNITIQDIKPSGIKELEEKTFFELLDIDYKSEP